MFSLIEVIDESQAEDIRVIRNSCKDFMTRNTNYISESEQLEWFRALDRNVMVPLLFLYSNINVGYGIIRVEEKCCLLSGGLKPEFRDLGYGKVLFEMLMKESKKYNSVTRLEVLKQNHRAVKTYLNTGFSIIDESDTLYFMEAK